MEVKEIAKLMEILKESQLSYLQLQRESGKITLKKSREESQPVEYFVEGCGLEEEIIAETLSNSSVVEIKSLQIGKLSYVSGIEVGSEIVEGDIIARIKALGVLKDIKSAVSGKIIELVVAEGEVVGYGNVIAKVEVEGGAHV